MRIVVIILVVITIVITADGQLVHAALGADSVL